MPITRNISARLKGLYVILDPAFCKSITEVEAAKAIIRGGASIIQWRDKVRDKGEQLPIVRQVVKLCRNAGVVSIVNDHLDLALISNADGVHVGQKDLPVAEVKRFLPKDKVLGCSNATFEEALQSERDGATYVAVGSIYPTASKERTRPAGLETLRQVKASVSVPVVAIGGINRDNIGPVLEAGADVICVISGVLSASDIEKAARELSSIISAHQAC